MAKWILNSSRAQKALSRGTSILRSAVAPTLGPIGRTVLMDRRWAGTSVVSDGFTINRELELWDPFADMAIRFLEDASEKVRSACGDGTTTTVLLAEALIRACQPLLASGADPMALSRALARGAALAVDELRDMSCPVADAGQLAAVASLAAKDAELGRVVGELVWDLGADGAFLALESQGRTVEHEVIEGFRFDRGAISPAFLTDPVKVEAVLENPYLLLTAEKLERVDDILPALERILPEAHTLVVVAQDVTGEALAGLAMNKERGNLEVLAVKAPGLGGRMEEQLEELAAATGATVLPNYETGRTLAGITIEDLGRADRVVANRQMTTVFGGRADPKRVAERMAILRNGAAEAQTDKYRRELTERIGAILGKTAVLKVGGLSQLEVKEKVVRVRNAVAAAQAALRGGLLPGGGAALARAGLAVGSAPAADDLTRIGFRAVQRALEAPLLSLARNAGEHGPLVLAAVRQAPAGSAYDALTGQVGPASESGILDPMEMVVAALQRSVSVAAALLTVDTVIVSPPEPGVAGERPDVSARYE